MLTAARLATITSYVGTTVVQQRRLRYEQSTSTGRSLLASISQGASDASDAPALPATAIDWQQMGLAFDDQGTWLGGSDPTTSFLSPAWSTSTPRYLADVNGDGRADIVGFRNGVQVSTSTGSGFSPSSTWTSNFGTGWTDATPRTIADVNGDGMTDVVGFGYSGVVVALSNGSNGFGAGAWTQPSFAYFGQGLGPGSSGWSATNDPRLLVDVNGDARADIVGFGDETYVATSTGSSFNPPVAWNQSDFTGTGWYPGTGQIRLLGDVNGDGMADVVGFGTDGVTVGISTGDQGNSFDTGLWPQNQSGFGYFGQNDGWGVSTNPRVLADVNGDGLLDIVGFKGGTQVALSNGKGFETPVQWIADFSTDVYASFPWGSAYPRTLTDVNGDGMADIVGFGPNPYGAVVALSTGSKQSGGFTKSTWNQGSLTAYDGGNASTPTLLGDVDGDGMTDAVGFGSAFGATPPSVTVALTAASYPDLATRITDGLGRQYQIAYAPITNPGVYSKGSAGQDAVAFFGRPGAVAYNDITAEYPSVSLISGQHYVVAGYTETSDASVQAQGSAYGSSYTYVSYLLDVLADRPLGFAQVTRVDEDSKRTTTHRFSQTYPLAGKLLSVHSVVGQGGSDPLGAPGDVLGHVALGYQATVTATSTATSTAAGTPAPSVYLVKLCATRRDSYTYDTWNQSIGHSFGHDRYGNRTSSSYLGQVTRGQDQSPSDDGSACPALMSDSAADDNVYTCASYDNAVSGNTWKLGYPTARKQSTSSACTDFDSFDEDRDLSLGQVAYADASTMNPTSLKVWDDGNDAWMTYSFAYDDFGNRRSVTRPGNATTTITYDATYHTYRDTVTSPANEQGVALTTRHGYDPGTGQQVAQADANGNVTIQVLDGFGRPQLQQGPLPDDVPGVVASPNLVSALVTGSADFAGAPVVTVQQQDWMANGARIYTRTLDLQDWPTSSGGSTQWTHAYRDARARVYQQLVQGAGDNVLTATAYDRANQITQRSLPALVSGDDPGEVDTSALSWNTVGYDVYRRPTRVTHPSGAAGADSALTTIAYPDAVSEAITRAADQDYAYTRSLQYGHASGHGKRAARRKLSQNAQPPANMVQMYRRFEHATGERFPTSMTVPGAGGAADGNGDGAGDAVTSYGHDLLGRLEQITDPATPDNEDGVPNQVSYDSLGRKLAGQSGDFGSVRLVYGDNGKKRSMADANGTTTYGYDALGRTTSITRPDGTTVAYTYDEDTVSNGKGQLTSVRVDGPQGAMGYTFGYDVNGNRNRITLTTPAAPAGLATGVRYDPQGRAIQRSYPDDTVLTRSYALGKLSSLRMGDTTYASYSDFTAQGLPQRTDFGQGVVSTAGYSPAGLFSSLTLTDASAKTIYALQYTWNDLRQLTSIAYSGSGAYDYAQTFTYDQLRLATASGAYGSLSYGYDASGNTTRQGDTAYTYDQHRVVSGTNGANEVFSGSYDPSGNGNLVARTRAGDSWQYGYDAANRLVSARGPGAQQAAVYLYDDTGALVQKTASDGTVTVFLDDVYTLRVPAGAGAAATATRYVSSDTGEVAAIASTDGADSTLYFHLDHLTSTLATTDQSGAVSSQVLYEPYGAFQVTGPDSFGPKFTGKRFDSDASLYYFGARYYDPATTRFVTADTRLGARATRQDALNRYEYALDSPTMYVDPTGHMAYEVWDLTLAVQGAQRRIDELAIVQGRVNDVLRVVDRVAGNLEQLEAAGMTGWGNGFLDADTIGRLQQVSGDAEQAIGNLRDLSARANDIGGGVLEAEAEADRLGEDGAGIVDGFDDELLAQLDDLAQQIDGWETSAMYISFEGEEILAQEILNGITTVGVGAEAADAAVDAALAALASMLAL